MDLHDSSQEVDLEVLWSNHKFYWWMIEIGNFGHQNWKQNSRMGNHHCNIDMPIGIQWHHWVCSDFQGVSLRICSSPQWIAENGKQVKISHLKHTHYTVIPWWIEQGAKKRKVMVKSLPCCSRIFPAEGKDWKPCKITLLSSQIDCSPCQGLQYYVKCFETVFIGSYQTFISWCLTICQFQSRSATKNTARSCIISWLIVI